MIGYVVERHAATADGGVIDASGTSPRPKKPWFVRGASFWS